MDGLITGLTLYFMCLITLGVLMIWAAIKIGVAVKRLLAAKRSAARKE